MLKYALKEPAKEEPSICSTCMTTCTNEAGGPSTTALPTVDRTQWGAVLLIRPGKPLRAGNEEGAGSGLSMARLTDTRLCTIPSGRDSLPRAVCWRVGALPLCPGLET